LAQREIDLGHEIKCGARVRFLSQHVVQICNRALETVWLCILGTDARTEQQRLPIVLVFLQDLGDLSVRTLHVATRQQDLAKAVATLHIIRRLGNDALVDLDRVIGATNG